MFFLNKPAYKLLNFDNTRHFGLYYLYMSLAVMYSVASILQLRVWNGRSSSGSPIKAK